MTFEQRAREIAESLHATPEFVDESDIACARLGIIEGLEMGAVRVEQLLGCSNHVSDAIRALIEEQKL